MKSVGGAMSLGRSFAEAFRQGAAVAGDQGCRVLDRTRPARSPQVDLPALLEEGAHPQDGHFTTTSCCEVVTGASIEDLARPPPIDPWFPRQIVPGSVRSGRKSRDADELTAPAAPGEVDRLVRPADRGAAGRWRRRLTGLRVTVAALHERLDVHPYVTTPVPPVPELARHCRTTAATCRWTLPPHQRVAPQPTVPRFSSSGQGPRSVRGIEFDYSCVHAAVTLSLAG